MTLLGKYVREARDADSLSRDKIRAEANAFLQLRSFIVVWADLAEDTRNKTEWNNFGKYVLSEVQQMAKEIKENEK
tara:strand:- start:9 stop:236 length:228 start_codon:yes stop_codon:yes gene_type:complete